MEISLISQARRNRIEPPRLPHYTAAVNVPAFALFFGLSLAAPELYERETVVAVPFSTTAADHVWIGSGLAHALNLRIYAQPGLNAMSLRQVRAAARNDGLDLADAANPAVASALGRQLGADTMVVGDYAVEDGRIIVELRVLQPGGGQILFEGPIHGTLDGLVELEAKLAATLATALGAKQPDVSLGAFGTRSVVAWREVTLGLGGASWQSLSPRNASASKPRVLSEETLATIDTHFRTATELDEDYGEAWAGRGLVAALRDDFDAALEHLTQATAVSGAHQPTAVLASYYLLLRQGRADEAAGVLERALAVHPGFLHARGYLAELYIQLGRYEDALKAYGDYLAVAPRQPWALAQRGYVRAKLGDTEGAIADTITAVDLLPRSPTLLIELASRYIDAGKLIGAEDTLRHALELHPEEGRIYVRLCYVYLLQENEEVAIPLCEKSLSLNGATERRRDRGYAHLNLAQAYGRAGELDTAFDHLERAKSEGIRRFDALRSDPALAKMRADRRFAKVVGDSPK